MTSGHDMSVLFVGHNKKEDLHLVSMRPQKGVALDTGYVVGRI